MLKMHFDFRDVFLAARLGLSPKKIWVIFWGLATGFFLYGVFGYLAHLVEGRSLVDIWIMFGLVPAAPWPGSGSLSWLLWIAGLAGALVAYLLTTAVAARLAAEQQAGNEFYEVGEAINYLRDGWKSVLGGPLVIFSFIIFLVLLGILSGWWGRIPVIGELTMAILSLPIYFVCLLLAFLMFSLMLAIFYTPVVAGATKGDAFDNIFEIFSSITSQPWRLIIYTGLLKVVSFAAVIVFACFTAAALAIGFSVLAWSMGDKFTEIVVAAFNLYTPPMAVSQIISVASDLPKMADFTSFMLATPSLTWSGQVAAFIIGMAMNIIRLLVVSYGLAVFISGQTIIYRVIVMKRDQRDIFSADTEANRDASNAEVDAVSLQPELTRPVDSPDAGRKKNLKKARPTTRTKKK